jgi:hypothetical protein
MLTREPLLVEKESKPDAISRMLHQGWGKPGFSEAGPPINLLDAVP